MKILIIKFRNIGDVLLTTPLIKNLKLNYPQAKIDVALNSSTKAMLKYNPYVNKIFSYDRDKIKSFPLFKRIKEEVKFFKRILNEKYDIVINLTRGDRGSLIAFFNKNALKIGYSVSKNFLLKNVFDIEIPGYGNRHIVDATLDVIRLLDKKIYEKKVEIFWSEKEIKKVDQLIKHDFIHIHPVSRWMFKCVDDKIMAEIINFLHKKGEKVVLTASPDKKEIQKVKNIISLCDKKPIDLSGQLNLNEVAYLSSKAKLFIGVDTAIMHMAAAVNTPVIAFFGPSAAFNWGPWDNDMFESGYKKSGIQKMGKHIVIQHNWDCIPCIKDGCGGSKISECLMKFDMTEIYKIIEERI